MIYEIIADEDVPYYDSYTVAVILNRARLRFTDALLT
jgi:hypothetical protein